MLVSRSGLVTVTGGKWTTYRAMAEDVLEKCFDEGLLPRGRGGSDRRLAAGRRAGGRGPRAPISAAPGLHLVWQRGRRGGSAARRATAHLGGGLTEAMVRFAARHEYARTVEDVLARRSRLLFLDAGWPARWRRGRRHPAAGNRASTRRSAGFRNWPALYLHAAVPDSGLGMRARLTPRAVVP